MSHDAVPGLPHGDPDAAAVRRSRLIGIKLRALVRDHLSDDEIGEPAAFVPGAALLHRGAAWVLIDDRPAERLGAALVWASRAGATELHLIAESGTGVLARRAAEFTLPISVWHAAERELWPAVAEPWRPPEPVPAHQRSFREHIVAGGAEPIEEHGVLAGEVRGLEVCRVVDDPHTATTRLEVGVGAHDREAYTMLHGDLPSADSLARVVAMVAQHRRLDAPQHPLNRLARERLLRWELIHDPGRVGARELVAAAPPMARANLKDPVPCVAIGTDVEGRDLVVVCSVGVDLDLVPYAADARLAVEASRQGVEVERLLVVTPGRDRFPVTDEIAGLLRRPLELVAFD